MIVGDRGSAATASGRWAKAGVTISTVLDCTRVLGSVVTTTVMFGSSMLPDMCYIQRRKLWISIKNYI